MTKNLLALGAAGLIAFVVVGWFLGWYHVQSVATSNGREFKVDLNTPKITEDINKGKVKLEGILTKQPNITNPTPPPLPTPNTPSTSGRVTIVPVTAPDGSFVLPGSPVNVPYTPAQVLPPLPSAPPSLTPPSLTPPPLPPQ